MATQQLDPIKPPAKPEIRLPTLGSFNAQFDLEAAVREAKYAAERKRNAPNIRVGDVEDPSLKRNSETSLSNFDDLSGRDLDRLEGVLGLFGDSASGLSEVAGEKAVEIAESVKTLSMKAIEKGGFFILFVAADMMRQARGKELPSGANDEAMQHDATHAEEHKAPEVYQPDGVLGFFRDVAIEGEVQVAQKDFLGIGLHIDQNAISHDEAGNSEIAQVRQFLAEKAREIREGVIQVEREKKDEEMRQVHEEAGITIEGYVDRAVGNATYAVKNVRNAYHKSNIYDMVEVMKREKADHNDGANALARTGSKSKATGVAAGDNQDRQAAGDKLAASKVG